MQTHLEYRCNPDAASTPNIVCAVERLLMEAQMSGRSLSKGDILELIQDHLIIVEVTVSERVLT